MYNSGRQPSAHSYFLACISFFTNVKGGNLISILVGPMEWTFACAMLKTGSLNLFVLVYPKINIFPFAYPQIKIVAPCLTAKLKIVAKVYPLNMKLKLSITLSIFLHIPG